MATQAVTMVRCGNQLTQCSMEASGMADLDACSEVFDECSAKAAADLDAKEDLLADCRADASACLSGANKLGDVRACRDVYNRCAVTAFENCASAPDETLPVVTEDAVQATALLASARIRAIHRMPSVALDLLETCRSTSLEELRAVQNSSDALIAHHVFEQCALDAIDLAKAAADAR